MDSRGWVHLGFTVMSILAVDIVWLVNTFNIDTSHPIIYTGPDNSYFGYSVAMLKNSQGTWVVVGAPRDNDSFQPMVIRPGALYRCPFMKDNTEQTECEQVLVDNFGEYRELTPEFGKTIHHNKTDQWLGVSLDVKKHSRSGVFEFVLVCAHRWKDAKLLHRGYMLWMNGICYEISPDLPVTNDTNRGRLIPALVDNQRLYNNTKFEFSFGQLGASAQYAKDDRSILMGAPGLNSWTGGAVILTKENDDLQYVEPSYNKEQGYIGYSLTSGRFTSAKKTFLALGAPRAHGTGQVQVFAMDTNEKTIYAPKTVINGTLIGSYFGAALCATDINNDRLDDLLVGAPLYSDYLEGGSVVDGGRVYVFLSNDLMEFTQMEPLLNGSNSVGARFGSAIASLGDINGDLYGDIAVGAPFEDEHRGAVYVYNGHNGGLSPNYTQRISARKLNTGLSAFGASFSQALDVDNNRYGDVVVGSFLSNNAVLLRTRPLIDLSADTFLEPEVIDISGDSPSTALTIRFRYKGEGRTAPFFIKVTFTLDVDIGMERPRAVILGQKNSSLDNHQSEAFSLSRNISVLNNIEKELTFTVLIKSLREKTKDVKFRLLYDIQPGFFESQPCVICPMLKLFDGNKPQQLGIRPVIRTIAFEKYCGVDQTCRTNLLMKVKLVLPYKRAYVLIGETREITIEVSLLNEHERAYLTIVYFTIPKHLRYRHVELNGDISTFNAELICPFGQGRNNTIGCLIGDPLLSQARVTFRVRFGFLEQFAFDADQFEVEVNATTSSEENDLSDNYRIVDVPVRVDPAIDLIGVSVPEQPNLRVGENASDPWIPVRHVYDIHNKGPSLLPSAVLQLQVPVLNQGPKDVIIFDKTEVHDETSHKVFPCTQGEVDLRLMSELNDSKAESFIESYREQASSRDVLVVNCENFLCQLHTCQVYNIPVDRGALLTVDFRLHRSVLSELRVRGILKIVTAVTLVLPDENIYVEPKREYKFHVVSDVFPFTHDLEPEPFPIWILIVSIAVGLLIFLLLFLFLCKCGFFNRHKFDDRDRLVATPESDPHGGNPVGIQENAAADDTQDTCLPDVVDLHGYDSNLMTDESSD